MSGDDAHGTALVGGSPLFEAKKEAFVTPFASVVDKEQMDRQVELGDVQAWSDPALWPEWAALWYAGMAGLAVFHLIAYVCVAARQTLAPDDEITTYQRLMRNLGFLVIFLYSIVYCFLPCQTLGRYVWWDTVFSSILVSRVLAATADLSWVLQVAMGILFCENELYRAKYGPSDPSVFSWHFFTQGAVRAMVFLIVAAQSFSFCGAATGRFLWYACGEYSWGLAFLITAPADVYIFAEARRLRRLLGAHHKGPSTAGCVCQCCPCAAELFGLLLAMFCAVYLPWVFIADAPLYLDMWQRQRQGEGSAAQLPDLEEELSGIREGALGALYERHFSRDWEVWWPALVFRSVHYCLTCWAALAMSDAPRLGLEQFERGTYSLLGDLAHSDDALDS